MASKILVKNNRRKNTNNLIIQFFIYSAISQISEMALTEKYMKMAKGSFKTPCLKFVAFIARSAAKWWMFVYCKRVAHKPA
jgi:hypothetical protein